MPESTDVKPAFGQVWQWREGPAFMLISPAARPGEWVVRWMNQWGGIDPEAPMAGLHDDPRRRIDGYELLSEVES